MGWRGRDSGPLHWSVEWYRLTLKGFVAPGLLLTPSHPTPPRPVPDVNSRSARVLFLLVVPGHLVFLYTISCMQGGHTTLTLIFIVFYMTAALLQVQGAGARGGPGLPAAMGGEAQVWFIRHCATSFSVAEWQADAGQGLWGEFQQSHSHAV